MMYLNKKDVAKVTKRIGLSCVVLSLAGCISPETTPVNGEPLSAIPREVLWLPPSAQDTAGIASGITALSDIQTELANRQQEYDAVTQQARTRGMLGGALQGGLLVMLMTGSPEGALVGGVAGGAVGYWAAEKSAAQLVQEHRNFLIRKWSIESILEAARLDTENTRFDLLLSERALKAARSKASGPEAIGVQSIALLSDFQNRAEGRALVLHEVMPIFANDPSATQQLSVQLKDQVALLSDMKNNIDEILKSHD